MAGGTGAILSGVSSAVGAGASLLGGSNASDAAESASDASNANAQNNAMLQLMGFYGSKTYLEDQAQKAREGYYVGRSDQNAAGQAAINALAGNSGYWNTAYDRGSSALNSGLAEWDGTYNQIRADEMPYMNFGQMGLTGYTGLMEDPSSITTNPGYQFRLDQGLQGLDRSAAAKGKLFSGAQGKAISEYGQNYATNEYDKALARYKSAIDTGQTSVGRVDQAGLTKAAGKASLYNSLAGLATTTAQGLANTGTQQAQVYQNWGDDMWDVAKTWGNNENDLGKQVVSAWQNAANQTTSSNNTNTDNANQATTAGASAENQALSGVGSSINNSLSNYLKSDSNNSSYGGYASTLGSIAKSKI